MKKPLKDLTGNYVTTAEGKSRRFSKRSALRQGRGEFRANAPKIVVRDAGSHWELKHGGEEVTCPTNHIDQ